ncbi:glycosyl transferase [Pseudomonas sp. CFBP13508]|uniref:Glycosyltransferase n=1 Tax=Pseudomonas mercuritolerans TaxID=2951809 RepID=A0ABT2XVH9_9PSED|nr:MULTISPECIES: glycosyltransferase [Pseudomonas]MCV2222706.1 glycosyltransferase [Pseudomonas mercuritolerans]TKJ73435.1 glycosyl transferase [Pseudomonas sp. CFBP13508]
MVPLVSYIVPAYNHDQYVKCCLDSILADIYDNKEIVIIDDGSSDNTAKVIEQWIAAHGNSIKVLYRSRANKGVTATINELTNMATGEFLRLGASDDYFLSGGSEKLVNYLLGSPDKVAVIGDSIVVDENGKVVHNSGMTDLHRADKQKYLSENGIIASVISDWAVAGPVPLVRKAYVTTGEGWDEGLRIDDWDFFLRIAAHGALGFIDEPVCAYRVHSSNTCRTSDVLSRIKNLQESRRVAQKHVKKFKGVYRRMLQAQCFLIGAKIAFLKRRWLTACFYMTAYMVLTAVGKFKA